MSFADPLLLLLLLLLPVGAAALVAARRRRMRHAVRLPTAGVVAMVMPRQSRVRRWLAPALLALAVALLVVGVARPQRTVQVPIDQAALVLVTDASGSMQATDVSPDRLSAARSAAERLLEDVPAQLRVGLVGFSTSPTTVAPPTTDRRTIRDALLSLRADGGTATGDALASALQQLRPGDQALPGQEPAAILLLSDGMVTNGRDPVDVARQARRLGVRVSTVALGTPEGVVNIPGPSGATTPVPPDPGTMRRIARASGGAAFEIDDPSQLERVYERVGIQAGTEPEVRELTWAFAGGGLLVLVLAVGLGLQRRPRIG